MYRREPLISHSVDAFLSRAGRPIGRTFTGREVSVDDMMLSTHSVILGRTGSGKSSLLKILGKNLASSGKCSVLILDPHGDLARWMISQFPNDAIVIPSRPVTLDGREWAITMNPLHGSRSNPEFYSGWVRDAFSSNGVFSQGTWGPRLEVIFSSLLSSLIQASEETRLSDLLDMLLDSGRMRRFAGKVPSPQLSAFLKMAMADWKGWNQYVASSINKLLPLITDAGIRNIVSGQSDSADFSTIFSSAGNLIVPEIWKGSVSEETYGIISILMILKAWGYRLTGGDSSVPLYIVVDEAQLLPENIMDRILREGRKYNIRMILATQFASSAKSYMAENLISNPGCFFSFSLPREEARAISSAFFPDPLASKLTDVLTSQGFHRCVIWSRDGEGSHGPLSFVPEMPEVTADADIEAVKERSVMHYGNELYLESDNKAIDLHEYLVTKICDYLTKHGMTVTAGSRIEGGIPDCVAESGPLKFIVEVEVSDLVAFGRVINKVINYAGYRIIFVVPPGHSGEFFRRLLTAAAQKAEQRQYDLISALREISIIEYSEKFRFFASGKLRSLIHGHLETGSFILTLKGLPNPQMRVFLYEKYCSGHVSVNAREVISMFGEANASRISGMCSSDGSIDIMKVFGVRP